MARRRFRKRRGGFRKRGRAPRATLKLNTMNADHPTTTSSIVPYIMKQDFVKRIAGPYGKYLPYVAQAYTMGKKALDMLNAELKYHNPADVSTTFGAPSLNGELVLNMFDTITQGDGATNRDGIQIRVKAIQIKMQITKNASASTTNFRWVMFIGKRPQIGTDPVYTDIYDSTSVPNPFINIEDQWHRWKILRQGEGVLTSSNTRFDYELYFPCSIPVRWDATPDIIVNPVYIMWACDDNTNQPALTYRYRIRFYDN